MTRIQTARPGPSYRVLPESETLRRAIAGASLSRFGDGELRLCVGGKSISQDFDGRLCGELRGILAASKALVCVPNPRSPVRAWDYYRGPLFARLFRMPLYGSAFISRPDSAPWINVPEYWREVAKLWQGRDIVFVRGTDRSLRVRQLDGALSLAVITAPERNAYAEVDSLERAIGTPRGSVILCLGATATVLAHRLAAKGVHALDLGHLGMFLRRVR